MRNKLYKMLVASIMFATIFTISCSSDDNDDSPPPSSGTSSSSSEGNNQSSSSSSSTYNSSSSVISSSSSSEGNNQSSSSSSTYNSSSSVISSSSSVGGSNSSSSGHSLLEDCVDGTVPIGNQCWQKSNLNVVPSKGVSKCYDDDPSNCDRYGKLYDWEAAMSACPSGLHLPTKEEWDALASYIESDKSCTDCVGNHLKSRSGWTLRGWDSYGFSAFPGGNYNSDGSHDGIYMNSFWWSASENENYNAYIYTIMYSGNFRSEESAKNSLMSVRCLHYRSKVSSPAPVCIDGTVPIGNQCWQKSNLNVVPSTGTYKCYEDDPANCDKYGKLYDWEAAMSVCPSGFHLPTKEEWETLKPYIESDKSCFDCSAKHLKATSGWLDNGNGLDSYGFSALPGGLRSYSRFLSLGTYGYWWSATTATADGTMAHNMNMRSSEVSNFNGVSFSDKSNYLSVRCLQNLYQS